jgi:hypothetical protein
MCKLPAQGAACVRRLSISGLGGLNKTPDGGRGVRSSLAALLLGIATRFSD